MKLEESGEAEVNAIERLQSAQAVETPSTQDHAVGGHRVDSKVKGPQPGSAIEGSKEAARGMISDFYR